LTRFARAGSAGAWARLRSRPKGRYRYDGLKTTGKKGASQGIWRGVLSLSKTKKRRISLRNSKDMSHLTQLSTQRRVILFKLRVVIFNL
jgi:hypothetical protein